MPKPVSVYVRAFCSHCRKEVPCTVVNSLLQCCKCKRLLEKKPPR